MSNVPEKVHYRCHFSSFSCFHPYFQTIQEIRRKKSLRDPLPRHQRPALCGDSRYIFCVLNRTLQNTAGEVSHSRNVLKEKMTDPSSCQHPPRILYQIHRVTAEGFCAQAFLQSENISLSFPFAAFFLFSTFSCILKAPVGTMSALITPSFKLSHLFLFAYS